MNKLDAANDLYSKHLALRKELEDKYDKSIRDLLQQKAEIIAEIDAQFQQQLTKITEMPSLSPGTEPPTNINNISLYDNE